ncbi:GPR1/FUN34/yaaH family-domain-containing protein [Suillus lakei]|nr:GPR1/FUN34/yaaH family-domain-containing protein [Suillus lakei]
MSSNSVTEKEGSKDNYYVQTVNMDAPAPPAPQMQPYQRTFGNPAPLGMLAYGTVFLCSSILTLASKSVGGQANLVLVFAAFYGGISQTLVGMWEMFLGNTFSATVFTTYGGFNFSYAALYLPSLGIAAAYTVDGVVGQEFYNIIGIYLAIWDLITFLFLLGAIRTTAPIVATLGFTVCALTCLSANAFTGNPHLATAGGALGIIASFGAYYGALSLFWTQQTTFSFIRLPPLITAPSNV